MLNLKLVENLLLAKMQIKKVLANLAQSQEQNLEYFEKLKLNQCPFTRTIEIPLVVRKIVKFIELELLLS